jgi:hypothetical protein
VKRVQSAINEDRTIAYLKRLADILVHGFLKMSARLELLQFIFELNGTYQTPKIRRMIMYMVELGCEIGWEDSLVLQHEKDFISLFETYLVDADIDVRVASLKTTSLFFAKIVDEGFIKRMQSVLPVLLSKLIECVTANQDAGIESIDSISNLFAAHPKAAKPIFDNYLTILNEILGANQFSSGLIGCALNSLIVLSSVQSVLMRRSEIFRTKTCAVFMDLLAQPEDQTLEEWELEKDETTISKNDCHSLALENIPKLIESLGNKFLLPNFIKLVAQNIQSTEWRRKFGGLMAMTALAERSADFFKSELDNIVGLVLPGLEDNNRRVIYATLTALGALCEEYQPDIQIKHHGAIIKSAVHFMQYDTSMKIQCQAVALLVSFARGIDATTEEQHRIIISSIEELMTHLMPLFEKSLERNHQPLQKEILALLSLLAVLIKDEFGQYYPRIMPGLKQLLANVPSDTPDHVALRVDIIDTIGYMISSLKGKITEFAADFDEIIKALLGLQGTIPVDDPQHSSILTVYSQMAETMREHFAPYLQSVIEKVLMGLDIDIDFHVEDELSAPVQSEEKRRHCGRITLDTRVAGVATLTMNTMAMEQKNTAAAVAISMLKSLGKLTEPYLGHLLESAKKYIDFAHSKELRMSTTKMIYIIFRIAEQDTVIAATLHEKMAALMKQLENCTTLNNSKNILSSLC